MNSKHLLDIASQCGATHKTNLGVYQFVESALIDFATKLLANVENRIEKNKFTLGDIQVSHNPQALIQYNRAVNDCIYDLKSFLEF